jgi:pyruvate dehydrogenase E2 component (dihydrolipoamide acetyltransferase)
MSEDLNEIKQKIIPFKGIRKIIADHMRNSLDTAAQANHRLRVDMSKVMALKVKFKTDNMKISISDITVKAVSDSLIENPIMNSTLTDEGIFVCDHVNIGIAVAIDNGLVVPVIRNVQNMTLDEIASTSSELIEKTRAKKFKTNDITGGTFTITNLGMFGIENFTAIINTPEVGILAVGAIIKTPVVDEDNSIVVKPMMELSLTYDHRVVDGAPAALFLQSVKKHLETLDFIKDI